MKSVRIFLFQFVILPALLAVLSPGLRADSPDALQPDSSFSSTTTTAPITPDTASVDPAKSFLVTPTTLSSNTLTIPDASQASAPATPNSSAIDSAPVQAEAAPDSFLLHLSPSLLVDKLEVAFMDSLPFFALFFLLLGIWQLRPQPSRGTREVVEEDLPVIIPPRRIPQRNGY